MNSIENGLFTLVDHSFLFMESDNHGIWKYQKGNFKQAPFIKKISICRYRVE